jgi:hypothetical protein
MKSRFYLLLSLRTAHGFEVCGEFSLGSDRGIAKQLFSLLHGNADAIESACLHIDLMETVDELPEKIETKCCNLEEWCFNSKLLVKELFRLKNLEEFL